MNYYESYSNEELCSEWNQLETRKYSIELEKLMDEIEKYLLEERGVIAWNHLGQVIHWDKP